jgi:hypothetical protein
MEGGLARWPFKRYPGGRACWILRALLILCSSSFRRHRGSQLLLYTSSHSSAFSSSRAKPCVSATATANVWLCPWQPDTAGKQVATYLAIRSSSVGTTFPRGGFRQANDSSRRSRRALSLHVRSPRRNGVHIFSTTSQCTCAHRGPSPGKVYKKNYYPP